MTDAVAVDAKRILLRYGAPIAILDKVSESDRIEFAREIARTALPQRETRLRHLLAERGYTDPATLTKGSKGKGKGKSEPQAARVESAPAGNSAGKAGKTKPANAKVTNAKVANAKVASAKVAKGKPPKSKPAAKPPKAKPAKARSKK